MSFSLENLNESIYCTANMAKTFNNFLLAKIFEYLIIYGQSALIQRMISSKRFWSLFQSLQKWKPTGIAISVSLKCINICRLFLKFIVYSLNVQNKITCQIIPFFKKSSRWTNVISRIKSRACLKKRKFEAVKKHLASSEVFYYVEMEENTTFVTFHLFFVLDWHWLYWMC